MARQSVFDSHLFAPVAVLAALLLAFSFAPASAGVDGSDNAGPSTQEDSQGRGRGRSGSNDGGSGSSTTSDDTGSGSSGSGSSGSGSSGSGSSGSGSGSGSSGSGSGTSSTATPSGTGSGSTAPATPTPTVPNLVATPVPGAATPTPTLGTTLATPTMVIVTLTPGAAVTPTATPGFIFGFPTVVPFLTTTEGATVANDDFGLATAIRDFPFTASLDTSGALGAGDDPDLGAEAPVAYNTVWYRIASHSRGVVGINTFGSTYDTVLAVFTGLRGALTKVASNDDAASPPTANDASQSEVLFAVEPGVQYHILLASQDPWGGQAELLVNFAPGATMAEAEALLPRLRGLAGGSGPSGALLPSSASGTSVQLPPPARSVGNPLFGQRAPTNDRYFRETGFWVARDAFWDYFQRRGGVPTFGYPVSREFSFLGHWVQFFQRSVLQMMPDGSVNRMNLMEGDLMPYTRINSSTFPTADKELIDTAPSPSDPNYADKALAFLEANVVDQWEGMDVNFLKAFMGTVRYEDAFPQGQGEASLIPLMNLELWGLPTSRPARDPNNHDFVYQRFQRGAMHYDAGTGATQGLLLADYLKSIITGKGLPADLDQEASRSRFYRQLDPSKPGHMDRPAELLNTNLDGAFDPEATP